MATGDSAEVVLKGILGLSPEAQKKILEARCGGLCYVPPTKKKPAAKEEENPDKEKKNEQHPETE